MKKRAAQPKPPGKTILVVDDEETVIMAVTMLLESGDYRVLKAASGAEALPILRAHETIAGMIVDLTMRRMSGEQLAAAVREFRPALPIIYMTGYDAQARKVDPPGEVLQKPFSREELLSCVKRAVEKT